MTITAAASARVGFVLMLDVAILCSGPSFAAFLPDPPRHDLYLGVNRVVEAFACDWWVFNDAVSTSLWIPKGSPRRFTYSDHAGIGTSCPLETNWRRFSMCSAMVLAEHLGASMVTIYGADWKGTLDWDGKPSAGPSRHPARWNNEIHAHGHIAAWLCQCGVMPIRIFQMPSPKKTTMRAVVDSSAPDPAPTGPRREFSIELTRAMQVGNVMLHAGECVGVISCHPEASPNFIVAGIAGGLCRVVG